MCELRIVKVTEVAPAQLTNYLSKKLREFPSYLLSPRCSGPFLGRAVHEIQVNTCFLARPRILTIRSCPPEVVAANVVAKRRKNSSPGFRVNRIVPVQKYFTRSDQNVGTGTRRPHGSLSELVTPPRTLPSVESG